jgi:hypothetical protein
MADPFAALDTVATFADQYHPPTKAEASDGPDISKIGNDRAASQVTPGRGCLRRVVSYDSFFTDIKNIRRTRQRFSPLKSWDDSRIGDHTQSTLSTTVGALFTKTNWEGPKIMFPVEGVKQNDVPTREVGAFLSDERSSNELNDSQLGILVRRTEDIDTFDDNASNDDWASDSSSYVDSNSEESLGPIPNERLTQPTKYFKELDDLEDLVFGHSMFQFYTVNI